MERVLLQQANSLLQPAKKVRIKTKFCSFYKTMGCGLIMPALSRLPKIAVEKPIFFWFSESSKWIRKSHEIWDFQNPFFTEKWMFENLRIHYWRGLWGVKNIPIYRSFCSLLVWGGLFVQESESPPSLLYYFCYCVLGVICTSLSRPMRWFVSLSKHSTIQLRPDPYWASMIASSYLLKSKFVLLWITLCAWYWIKF